MAVLPLVANGLTHRIHDILHGSASLPKHSTNISLRDGTVRHQGLERLPAIAVAGADHGRKETHQPRRHVSIFCPRGVELHHHHTEVILLRRFNQLHHPPVSMDAELSQPNVSHDLKESLETQTFLPGGTNAAFDLVLDVLREPGKESDGGVIQLTLLNKFILFRIHGTIPAIGPPVRAPGHG